MGCGNSKDHSEDSAANGSGETTARAPPPSVDALPHHRRGGANAASFPASSSSSSSCGQLPTPEHSGTKDTGRAIGIRRRRHRTPSPASLGRVAERAQSDRAVAAHVRAVQAGLDAVCRARTPPSANPLMSPLPSQHAAPEGDARDTEDLPALQDAV